MDNVRKEKSFRFAVRIVHLSQFLIDKKEFVISKQIMKSGTAIGALLREADHAESKPDFIHKMAIAQKECGETIYWLELLKETNYISEQEFVSLHNDAIELMKIITSIIRTTKSNLKR